MTHRGFTLIEALIALLVVAFGMLVVAGMQLTLNRNAEVARQRSEATRLAQEQIESLRSYNSIQAGAGLVAWNSIASGTDSPTADTNTTFTRTWTVGGSTADTMRSLSVTVNWTDRAGQTAGNTLTLNTFMAKMDPALSGALGFPLVGNGTIKRPKNRNLNIPISSVDLGNGQSAVPIGNWAAVFDNDSGWVVRYCAGTVTTAAQADACTTVNAYIVAGYVSGSSSTAINAATGVNLALLTGQSSKGNSDCSFGNAVNQNTGATISGYKYYICVIEVPSSGATWGGTLRLAGAALNSGANDYLVCRFQYPSSPTINSNQRNVQPYTTVAESLDQQNYYITTASSCPTVGGLALTAHQNCRSNNPNKNVNRLTDCPAAPDF